MKSHFQSAEEPRKYLKKNQRLCSARDFEALKQGTVDFRTAYFAVRMRERNSAQIEFKGLRIGVIASRRVGNAVARNRAKRRARELARLHQHELLEGIDLLFILRTPMAIGKWTEIESTFLWAMRRIGALKEEAK